MAALSCALTISALAQQSLVNFTAASAGVPNATSSPHDFASTTEKRWDFDLASPLFNTPAPIYGGLRVTNGSGLINNAATYLRVSTSSATWPNAPKVFAYSTSDSSTAANVVDASFLWQRADFVNTGSRVIFDVNSTLSVNVTDWWGATGVTSQIRFLVRNGGTYYVSEASRAGAGTLALADFNNNSTTGKRWAVIAPSGNTLALPNSGLTFAAVDFNDVQAVGWIGRGARAYSSLYGFDNFQAAGTVAQSAMIMSTNLGGVTDYSRIPVFSDIMKITAPWISQSSTTWNSNETLPLDPDGWPNGLPLIDEQGVQHSACKAISNLMIPGQYLIRFKGTGRFDITAGGGAGTDTFDRTRIAGLPVDSEGYRYAYTRNINITNARDGTHFWIIFRESVDDPATAARENLHDMQIIQPGVTAQEAKTTTIFSPGYVNQNAMYHTIRFMDWGHTNGHWASQWSQRTRPSRISQRESSTAIEYMVAYANQTGSNMWYCLPHKADDDYVRKAALVIRHGSKADGEPFNPAVDPVSARVWPGLNPNLKVYVEYSNETWNPAFAQRTYLQQQGEALGAQGLPMSTGDMAVSRYHSYRSAQIWKFFRDAFGTDTGARVVRVLGAQVVEGNCKDRLEAFTIVGLITNGEYPDALATAPYFGGPIFDQIVAAGLVDTITVQQILDRCQQFVDGMPTLLNQIAALCRQFKVRNINYEGGQHLVGTNGNQYTHKNTLGPKIEAANRDARMKSIYATYLSLLNASGVQEHAHFYDIGVFVSESGCWGAQEYFGQPLSAAAKASAIVDYVQANPANNQPPIARYTVSNNIDNDNNGSQPVVLSSAESRDLEGVIATSKWVINGTAYNGNTATVTLAIGDYTGTLTVTDSDGATDTIPISFTVYPKAADVTVYRSDFTGTAPALNTPWTKTSVISTSLTQSGWTMGVRPNSGSFGFLGGANVNNKFCVRMYFDNASFATLAQAISTNTYLSLTVTPTAGKLLDLRGATLTFDIEPSISAGRRFALMTSVGGFTEAAAIYRSPVLERRTAVAIQIPVVAAYNNLTGPVEIRAYFYDNQYNDKWFSLVGFDLKASVR